MLYKVFNKDSFFISPNVFKEIKKAKDKKFDFVENVFDLRDILKALYEFESYSKEEIDKLIEEIEKKDNIIIKNREELFE